MGAVLKALKGLRLCFGLRLRPGLELVQQAAFAEARLGHHGQHRQATRAAHLGEGVLKLREFRVASDHARGSALDAAAGDPERARSGAKHQEGGHRFGHTPFTSIGG